MRPSRIRCCDVDGCENTTENSSLSFFGFPKDPKILTKWMENLGPMSSTRKVKYICSDHFGMEAFVDTFKRRIHKFAIPNKLCSGTNASSFEAELSTKEKEVATFESQVKTIEILNQEPESHVTQLEVENKKIENQLRDALTENDKLIQQVAALKKELVDETLMRVDLGKRLQSTKRELSKKSAREQKILMNRNIDLEKMLEQERDWHSETLNAKDEEIYSLKEEIVKQRTEYRDLLNMKVALDLEIAAYKILEGEKTKLNVSPGNSHVSSPQSSRTTVKGQKRQRKLTFSEKSSSRTRALSKASDNINVMDHA